MIKHLLKALLLITPAVSVAATHVVSVQNFSFSPNSMNVEVGDIVRFQWVSGFHNSASTSVPTGATPWTSPNLDGAGDVYDYMVTAAGTYNYRCDFHASQMTGSFVATDPASVRQSTVDASSFVLYPNPASEKVSFLVNIKESDLSVKVFDVLGNKVIDQKIENSGIVSLPIADLRKGLYFVSLTADGRELRSSKFLKN